MPTPLTTVTVVALLVSGSLWASLRVAALPSIVAVTVSAHTHRQLDWRRIHARAIYALSAMAVAITALLALR